jgi:hypothetical protein
MASHGARKGKGPHAAESSRRAYDGPESPSAEGGSWPLPHGFADFLRRLLGGVIVAAEEPWRGFEPVLRREIRRACVPPF